jgi:enamine deaminase RidA (YjgF/YER057c/UK114 family)
MKSLLILCLAGTLLISLATGKKKNKDDITQTLEVLPDPPPAVVAETRRLVFHTSPLAGKGLLSQQTRDVVREILKQANGAPIVKIRAFVAGTGDLRRIPQIVSETFSEKKHLQLPVVSVIQAGGLPLEGAQVVIESITEAKREVNPLGLVYAAARERALDQPLQPLVPLAEQSLTDLAAQLAGHGDALSVTCFATLLDDAARISAAMAAKFPGAALDLVQTQRAASRSAVACEAVARATSTDGASVRTEKVILTGTQVAYGFSDDDARLAYRRMDRVLAPFGASTKTAAVLNIYSLSQSITAQAARLRPAFIDAAHPPATSVVRFEGLPGMDASFALEAVAPAL